MSKHFSEFKFENIQVDNQDYFECNRSIVEWWSRPTSPATKEEACGDVETGACSIYFFVSTYFSVCAELKQFCKEEWAEWAKTLQQCFTRLISSYQKRCFADFVAKSGTTRFNLYLMVL